MQFVQQKYERYRVSSCECHTEADQLTHECYDLQHEVEEGKERLDPLRTGYNLLARNVAEQAHDIDRLKSDHALRDQELNR